jgi:hypothetical protein
MPSSLSLFALHQNPHSTTNAFSVVTILSLESERGKVNSPHHFLENLLEVETWYAARQSQETCLVVPGDLVEYESVSTVFKSFLYTRLDIASVGQRLWDWFTINGGRH